MTPIKPFDVEKFRQLFPLLSSRVNGRKLIYFDNGATTQKPNEVITAESDYYQKINANVHRASHALGMAATSQFEAARQRVQQFIHAKESKEIIWTKGCTESINLVAQSWGRSKLKAGDEIVLSVAEHHANIVPWQIIAEQTGAIIKVLDIDEQGFIDDGSIESVINSATKIVCFSHISNVLARVNPIERIIAKAKSVGALTLIDGAQAVANIPVDVQALDCDFYAFSAHKMYGPTGVGVLYGKHSLLDKMPPYQSGGEMIKQVSFSGTSFNELPFKFEAGTPNIAGVVAFSAAIEFIEKHHLNEPLSYKKQLVTYGYQALLAIEGVKFLINEEPDLAIFSFTLAGNHHQDIATSLDAYGIAARSGHHCAMPLFEFFKLNGCIRLSLAPYNTFEEVDEVVNCLNALLNDDKAEKKQTLLSGVEQKSESQSMIERFCTIKSWDARHREIMLLGKTLPRLSSDLRSDETLIKGCESAAWLQIELSAEHRYQLCADSDAKVIRGLLVIVLAALNNKTGDQIMTFDLDGYFKQLGLIQHLSPSRGNGLLAIVEKIKTVVQDNHH
jgi:SufS family cysteine desulfurase